ncbi:MAG: cytochrome C [Chitinophagaceae bacterium]
MKDIYHRIIFFFSLAIVFILGSCNSATTDTANKALAAKVKRGDYLVNAVANCMHCHADRDFTKFAGPTVPGTEGKGGQKKGVWVSNITPAALESRTDEEIIRSITTGIRHSGDTLFATMPYMSYKYLTRYDAESIVAYLRTLSPINNTVPPRDLSNRPAGILSSMYQDWYEHDVYQNLNQSVTDSMLQRGKYLVTIGGCVACHTNIDLKLLAFKRDSLLAGGQLSNKPGQKFKVLSANITPDSATGIGAWTEDMFLAKFASYRNKEMYAHDPGKYNSEMPWSIFANMTDEDIRSIYRYLRTVKPIRNKVTKWPE